MTDPVPAELDQAVNSAMEQLIAVQVRNFDVTDHDQRRSWREDMLAAERVAAAAFRRVQEAHSFDQAAAWWSAHQAAVAHEERVRHWQNALDRHRPAATGETGQNT